MSRLLKQHRLISTVILICLVSALLGALFVSAQSSSITFTISGGQYPGAPQYTIYYVNSLYYAKDQNGAIYTNAGFSDAATLFNSISPTATGITITCNMAVTTTLLVYHGNYIYVINNANITLANGANCDLMRSADPNNFYNFILDGGNWDGNKAYQSGTSHVFNFLQYTVYAGSYPCIIRNVHVTGGHDDDLHISCTAVYSNLWDIYDSGFYDCDGSGIYANSISDCRIHNNIIQGNSYNLYLIGGNNLINDNYFAGADVCNVYLYGNTEQFNGGFIDCKNAPAILCDGLERSQFSDLTIRRVGTVGDNTFDAIILQKSTVDSTTNCIKNNFNNILIYQTSGYRFRCGINETDANQNGNIFGVINAPTGVGAATGTAAVKRSGATSLASNYSIIGTIL